MGEYLRPDVYVERTSNGVSAIESVGTATAGFIGTSARGKVGEPTFVTSWTDFVSRFARGLKSPFLKNSDLAYAIYGYFQNGGSRAYVTRVADGTETVALGTGTSVSFKAVDEGTWANDKLKASIVVDEEDTVKLVVEYDGEIQEVFNNVNGDVESENFIKEVVNGTSKYLTVVDITLDEGVTAIPVEEVVFKGGVDGLVTLVDDTFIGEKGLHSFDEVDEITIVSIPGQTSKAVLQGILDYCSNRGDCFAVLDSPMGMETQEIVTFKKELGGSYGAIYYPWGSVVDPIGKGKLKMIPPSGHIAGIYARTDKTRGVHKAPAGLEAQIKGFVETERKLANGDVEILNPLGVNCIMAKPNNGIVVWGARMIAPHLDRRYVSDIRLDINIEESLYKATQWTVFESNDQELWGKIIAQVKAYLYVIWSDGALFGENPDEAFFVKCDAELNTEEIRASGRVLVDIGYAKKKPAEFTIFRLSQKTATR